MPETKRHARTSGGELAYLDVGEGPPVVLMHGFPQSSFLWRDLGGCSRAVPGDRSGSAGRRRLDMPADKPLGIVAQAAYVARAPRPLGVGRFGVVGTRSAAASRSCSRSTPSVDAMVLLSNTAWTRGPPATREIQGSPPEQRVDGFAHAVIRAGSAWGWPTPVGAPPDQGGVYPSVVGPRERRGVLPVRRGDGRQGSDGREDDLARWRSPCSSSGARRTSFTRRPPRERLNEWIPTSTLGLLPGCRHFVLEDAIDTIGPMIDEYLRARYLRAPHGRHGDGAGHVMIQLERRPAWVDMAEDGKMLDDDDEEEESDHEPVVPSRDPVRGPSRGQPRREGRAAAVRR